MLFDGRHGRRRQRWLGFFSLDVKTLLAICALAFDV